MGIAELTTLNELTIFSHIITYGNDAGADITEQIREEIERMWNEPQGIVYIKRKEVQVRFHITAAYMPDIDPREIYENTDPLNNYFRIEPYVWGDISFVDGLGCNSGYFKTANIYKGSTTAAHEYGHTLGLVHPSDIDYRGKGAPGIMYPRGTLVDPAFQYDPSKPAGVTGGTMNPVFRKVRKEDIAMLNLQKLGYQNGRAILGEFSSIWHPDHASVQRD